MAAAHHTSSSDVRRPDSLHSTAACRVCRVNVPEAAPFTAVIKYVEDKQKFDQNCKKFTKFCINSNFNEAPRQHAPADAQSKAAKGEHKASSDSPTPTG